MKRFLFSLTVFCCALLNAQQTKLTINNFTTNDYRGLIYATNNSCYPMVGNTYYPEPTYMPLIVPAGVSTMISSFSSGIVPYWDVQTSATNPVLIRPYYHAAVSPTSTVALNTDWAFSKFGMYYPGTTTSIPYMNAGVSSGSSPCFSAPSYFTSPYTTFEAEWFTISGESFLQLY